MLSPFASAEKWVDDFAKEMATKAKKENIPGFAFVVINGDQAPQFHTYGVTHKEGKAVTSNTVFRLASVSKTFTAGLIAALAEQKKIDWQTPLNELLPDYSFDNYPDSPLRLRHIIGQSTGFSPNAYDNLIEANYSQQRVLSKLQDLTPLCKPGYCYTYQNAMFGVVDSYFNTTDTSFSDALQNAIFTPLKMKTASVGKDALEQSDSWARPHVAIAKRRWHETSVKSDYYRFSPAAGVNASVEDMAKWLEAMLGRHPNVLSPLAISNITHPRVKTIRELRRRGWKQYLKSANYGLGWRVYNFDGIKLNYHGGWVQGYRADVSFSPDLNTGYVMLMNAESNLINATTAEFWAARIKNTPKTSSK